MQIMSNTLDLAEILQKIRQIQETQDKILEELQIEHALDWQIADEHT
jgi:hypothetical protein